MSFKIYNTNTHPSIHPSINIELQTRIGEPHTCAARSGG